MGGEGGGEEEEGEGEETCIANFHLHTAMYFSLLMLHCPKACNLVRVSPALISGPDSNPIYISSYSSRVSNWAASRSVGLELLTLHFMTASLVCVVPTH